MLHAKTAMEDGKMNEKMERRGESRVNYCGVGRTKNNTFELAQKQLKILITKESLIFWVLVRSIECSGNWLCNVREMRWRCTGNEWGDARGSVLLESLIQLNKEYLLNYPKEANNFNNLRCNFII